MLPSWQRAPPGLHRSVVPGVVVEASASKYGGWDVSRQVSPGSDRAPLSPVIRYMTGVPRLPFHQSRRQYCLVRVALACQDPTMNPIDVTEVAPGEHRLYLVAGTTDVDDVISELGHEPNGVFWEGIVELLVMTEAPALDGRFSPDSEAGAFLAYSSDRNALDDLAVRLRNLAADGDRMRQLVEHAKTRGFEFYD